MMASVVAPLGAPTWWELALALVPLAVGVLYFALAFRRDQSDRRRLEEEEREQAATRHAESEAKSQSWDAMSSRGRWVARAVAVGDVYRIRAVNRLGLPIDNGAAKPVDRQELTQMERAATDLSWIGTLLLSEAVLIIFIVLHHFGEITDHYSELLTASRQDLATLALLMIRTAAYGTVVSTALYVLVRFAGTSFDQATRFRKRTHSAHVLNFVLEEYADNIKAAPVSLHSALDVFRAWNENVQSAFTSAKLVKDKQESVTGSVSPIDGAAFRYGQLPRTASPGESDAS